MKSTVKTEMIEIHTIAWDDFTFDFADRVSAKSKIRSQKIVVVVELISVVEVV